MCILENPDPVHLSTDSLLKQILASFHPMSLNIFLYLLYGINGNMNDISTETVKVAASSIVRMMGNLINSVCTIHIVMHWCSYIRFHYLISSEYFPKRFLGPIILKIILSFMRNNPDDAGG